MEKTNQVDGQYSLAISKPFFIFKERVIITLRFYPKKKIGIKFIIPEGPIFISDNIIPKRFLQFQKLSGKEKFRKISITFSLSFYNLKNISERLIKKRINDILSGKASWTLNYICVQEEVEENLSIYVRDDSCILLSTGTQPPTYIPKVLSHPIKFSISDLKDNDNFLHYILKNEESS